MACVFGHRRAVCKHERPWTAILAVMDTTDSEILRLLREDGRLSWNELGAAVGLSADAAAERVRRLRRTGVITGFTALIDPAAGGRVLEALVGVTLATGTDSDAFAAAAARLEPVTEVLHLTGAPDYQLRVACRDTAELDLLLRALRLKLGGVDTNTTVILRSRPPPDDARGRRARDGLRAGRHGRQGLHNDVLKREGKIFAIDYAGSLVFSCRVIAAPSCAPTAPRPVQPRSEIR